MLIDTRKVGPFTVHTSALPEDTSPRDHFDDHDGIDGIESGRYEWFCAKVSVEWEGLELATDYLGGCCYTTFEEFANGKDYHGDMIREAVGKAHARLKDIWLASANALVDLERVEA